MPWRPGMGKTPQPRRVAFGRTLGSRSFPTRVLSKLVGQDGILRPIVNRRPAVEGTSSRTPTTGPLAPHVFVEEIESSLPRQLGGSRVITRRRIVMEPMIGAFVNVRCIGHVIRFQRLLVSGPAAVDSRVEAGVVQ